MNQNRRILQVAGSLLIALLVIAGPMVTTAMAPPSANRVLGQLDFGHNHTPPVKSAGLSNPANVALDKSVVPNHVYVADASNNRVLGWSNAASFANGAPADRVIGQFNFLDNDCNHGGVSESSLCGPAGVAVDGAGNLYVSDDGNSRVLEYTTPYIGGANGMAANLAIGQSDLVSNSCNQGAAVSATSLCNPQGVALDGTGNLYVADVGNSRVLEYNAPLSTGMAATFVLGQANFVSNGCNTNGGLTANSLCNPTGVVLDGAGNLYVADENNNRVLEYNTPGSSDLAANEVFGQPDFVSSGCNDGGLSATSLCIPTGVALDGVGNLYVADTGFNFAFFYPNRVLEYNTPLTNTTADLVFGQPDFMSGGCNDGGLTDTSLCTPGGLAVDSSGNLYVVDNGNNRVLKYDAPLSSDMAAN